MQVKVTCISQEYDGPILVLPRNYQHPIDNNNFVASVIGSTSNGKLSFSHELTVNHDYCVYGILAGTVGVWYLIYSDDMMPGYYPAEIFDAGHFEMPLFWTDIGCYKLLKNGTLIVIGFASGSNEYPLICNLISQERRAISEFLKFKDSYHELD